MSFPPLTYAFASIYLAAAAMVATPYRDAVYPLSLVAFFGLFFQFIGTSGGKRDLRTGFGNFGNALLGIPLLMVGVLVSSWGNLLLALCPLMMGVSLVTRFALFRWMGYSRFLWVEFASIAGAFPLYIVGNLRGSHAWHGWAALAPIVAFAVFGLIMTTQRQLHMRRVGKTSIGVGEEAPDFTLESHRGERISLSDFRGDRPVLLFFVRGDWCPGCHIMLRAYENNRQKFKDKNTAVLAIGPDPTNVNAEMVDSLRLQYGLLSDEEHSVARQYRVLLEGPATGTPYDEGLPLPASFLVDREGIIRFTSRVDNGDMMLHPEAIFPVLESLEA